jgi:hypothetical protein
VGDLVPPYVIFERRIMKGKIAAYHQNVGQVLSEGNVYNFNIKCVQGAIKNHQEFEFELDEHGKVKVIYGNGVEKPSVPKMKKEKKQDTEEKTFLTEEN